MSTDSAFSKERILEKLRQIIRRYGEANELNEFYFSRDVDLLIDEFKLYERNLIWETGNADPQSPEQRHSPEMIDLVTAFVKQLIAIPDGCAEVFPFETVDELCEEYGIECDRYWR